MPLVMFVVVVIASAVNPTVMTIVSVRVAMMASIVTASMFSVAMMRVPVTPLF